MAKTNAQIVPDDELKKDVAAYRDHGGNLSAAARHRKQPRNTFRNRLELAEKRFGMKIGKVVDGRIDRNEAEKLALPKKGHVHHYLISSAQNNTYPHKAGWKSLQTYAAHLASLPKSESRIIIGTFSYALDVYGAKAVKRGKYVGAEPDHESLWYAPELTPFLCDDSLELAPGLMWCGEMNILPTAKQPLNGLEDYNGRNSNIVPHVKFALKSIPSLADEATKFNYSTGTVTQRNYIQKRAGIIAERHHSYGALHVEVDSDGNWFVRQLTIGDKGEIYDLAPRGGNGESSVKIKGDEVIYGNFLEAITWGDIHAAEMDVEVRESFWNEGGVLDQLRPRKQFWHDIFSMRSRGHHELKNFHRTFYKFVNGEGVVEDEIRVTADWATEAHRDWIESIVVRSNHCRHLDRWLNEAKPNLDPPNARYFMTLQKAYLEAMERGDNDFNILEYALRNVDGGIPKDVLFLGEDESFVILPKINGGIECGLHGDLGANGSRGSTRGLARLARPVNKAHDHTAGWEDEALSAGACSLNFPYMKGPNGHSISFIPVFENGARQIVTWWQGKIRA